MDNITYVDEIVNVPNKVISMLSEDSSVVGITLDKDISNVTDADKDDFTEGHIFDYRYVDGTTTEVGAFVWVELEIPRVKNEQTKTAMLYVDVACHSSFMKMNKKKHKGIIGNRRDNLVRFIDKKLNFSNGLGIGKLSLTSITTKQSIGAFSIREMAYSIPEFNYKDLK